MALQPVAVLDGELERNAAKAESETIFGVTQSMTPCRQQRIAQVDGQLWLLNDGHFIGKIIPVNEVRFLRAHHLDRIAEIEEASDVRILDAVPDREVQGTVCRQRKADAAKPLVGPQPDPPIRQRVHEID